MSARNAYCGVMSSVAINLVQEDSFYQLGDNIQLSLSSKLVRLLGF